MYTNNSQVVFPVPMTDRGNDFRDVLFTGENGEVLMSLDSGQFEIVHEIELASRPPRIVEKQSINRFVTYFRFLGPHCIFNSGRYAIALVLDEEQVAIIETKSWSVIARLGRIDEDLVTYLSFNGQIVRVDEGQGTIDVLSGPDWKVKQTLYPGALKKFYYSDHGLVTCGSGGVQFWDPKNWRSTSMLCEKYCFYSTEQNNYGFMSLEDRHGVISRRPDGTEAPPRLVEIVMQYKTENNLNKDAFVWHAVIGSRTHLFYRNAVVLMYKESTNSATIIEFAANRIPPSFIFPLGSKCFISIEDDEIWIISETGSTQTIARTHPRESFKCHVCRNCCLIANKNYNGHLSIQRIGCEETMVSKMKSTLRNLSGLWRGLISNGSINYTYVKNVPAGRIRVSTEKK